MTKDTLCISYRIDEEDRIVHVSENWQKFAVQNQADDLAPEKVLNRSLFDFISGDSSIYFTRRLLENVRRRTEPVILPFRCDAPDTKRFMQMLIHNRDDGLVEFRSCILFEEPRPPIPLLDPIVKRSDQSVTVCSWCKQVLVGNTDWYELEDAVRILDLFSASVQPRLTHGICPSCFDELRMEFI